MHITSVSTVNCAPPLHTGGVKFAARVYDAGVQDDTRAPCAPMMHRCADKWRTSAVLRHSNVPFQPLGVRAGTHVARTHGDRCSCFLV